jgi:anthraniloyl-CoA monooxygenase
VLAQNVAISDEARISPWDAEIGAPHHPAPWTRIVQAAHAKGVRIGIVLNHAGRRGAVRPAREARGLDRPLRDGAWTLIAPSPNPYTLRSQTPQPLDRAGMDHVRDDFVRAAQMANEAGFDLLMLHMAHGYLLASVLSPLTNRRDDEYGGPLENRMRFPLEVFDAVRAIWPDDKPLTVALNADDCAPGGFSVDDAVTVARALKEHGCDLIQVLAGQTIPDDHPHYGRGFLTVYSDRIRNEVGIPTLVGGYLTTSNEINTILAGGRADLCLLHPAFQPVLASSPRNAPPFRHLARPELPSPLRRGGVGARDSNTWKAMTPTHVI